MHVRETLISVMVTTVEFHDRGGSTQLILTEQAVFLDGLDNVTQRDQCTESLLNSLGTLLESGATN